MVNEQLKKEIESIQQQLFSYTKGCANINQEMYYNFKKFKNDVDSQFLDVYLDNKLKEDFKDTLKSLDRLNVSLSVLNYRLNELLVEKKDQDNTKFENVEINKENDNGNNV